MRTRTVAPAVDRPDMRSYGVERGPKGLQPWARSEKAFAAAHNYWVSVARPDGRPHATAVWGVWLAGKFWFSCSPTSVKARTLRRNPRCTVTTEDAAEAVIIEGVAASVKGRARLLPFVRAYRRKYDWDMDPAAEGYFTVTPLRAFAFHEAAERFGKTATRYRWKTRAVRGKR
jgi:hypothetical protein